MRGKLAHSKATPRRDMMARVAPAVIIESTETICCADRATATRVEMTMAMAVPTAATPTAPPSTAVTWSSGGRNRPGGAAHVDGDHRHGERQGRDQGGEQDGGQGFAGKDGSVGERRREQRFARAPLALASEGVGRHARGDHRWKEQERPADPGSRRPDPRLERGHDHADDRGRYAASRGRSAFPFASRPEAKRVDHSTTKWISKCSGADASAGPFGCLREGCPFALSGGMGVPHREFASSFVDARSVACPLRSCLL